MGQVLGKSFPEMLQHPVSLLILLSLGLCFASAGTKENDDIKTIQENSNQVIEVNKIVKRDALPAGKNKSSKRKGKKKRKSNKAKKTKKQRKGKVRKGGNKKGQRKKQKGKQKTKKSANNRKSKPRKKNKRKGKSGNKKTKRKEKSGKKYKKSKPRKKNKGKSGNKKTKRKQKSRKKYKKSGKNKQRKGEKKTTRGKLGKKKKRKSKKGRQGKNASKNIGRQANYTSCLAKFIEFARINEAKARSVQQQVKRINSFKKIQESKKGKKGDFKATYGTLLSALGGNESSPECDGKPLTGNGTRAPDKYKGTLSTLKKCEADIQK